MPSSDYPRRFAFHGVVMFVLSLAQGLFMMRFENPRMAVAAHVTGLLSGAFAVALGAAWARVRLGPRSEAVGYWTTLLGLYLGALALLLAAAFGTSHATPLAGKGFEGTPGEELLVTALLQVSGLAMFVGLGLIAWGLRPRMAP